MKTSPKNRNRPARGHIPTRNGLTQNKFGFDVLSDNPFTIFPYLQKRARECLDVSEILDLSRGDPGLGYSPAQRSRQFFGFLCILDTALNSNETGFRVHTAKKADLSKVMDMIRKAANASFKPRVAQEGLDTLDDVCKKLIALAAAEGTKLTKLDVLKGIFNYSTLLGGTYHTPQGEKIVRIAVAGAYRKTLAHKDIRSGDLIFTLGVNDAIGSIFKMLGTEGLGFLKPGDTVAASSPGYSPYYNEIIARKLKIAELPIAANTKHDFDEAERVKGIKAFFLISPNNPTGIAYSREAAQQLARMAEKNDAIIIVDEVYASFFDDFQSIWNLAEKRTIRLAGRSKIERSPGLRFGDVLITKKTNDYLTHHLLKNHLVGQDFRTYYLGAKAPGGMHGSFQHTAAVPGPSQILGMLHILLGERDRRAYIAMVRKNMTAFFKELGLPHHGEMYYGLFDLNRVPGCNAQNISINQKLFELATRHGVILIPAMRFFSEVAQKAGDKSNFVRVSLPNLPTSRVKEAARRIRTYLENPGA